MFLKQYESTKGLHMWLRLRKESGLPMPTTMDEARDLAMKNRRGMSPKMMRQKRRR